MPGRVNEKLRTLVASRAGFRCEYCLLHEDDSYLPHQVDHIVSRKHGGLSIEENLAYACFRCNCLKGTDVGALDAASGKLVRLFHPRCDEWPEHFRLLGPVIETLSERGEATARVLRFNQEKRIVERRVLIAAGRYPL